MVRSESRRSSQNKFHIIGPATMKARRPYVTVWNLGTTSISGGSWNEDTVVQPLKRPAWVAQTDNPAPGHACRHLYTVKPSLYVTRSATSSQCNLAWSRCVKPRCLCRSQHAQQRSWLAATCLSQSYGCSGQQRVAVVHPGRQGVDKRRRRLVSTERRTRRNWRNQ